MNSASHGLVSARLRARALLITSALLGFCAVANAAGTPVGTVIENTASVTFDLAGSPTTIQTNTTTLTVVERIDVVVTLQSGQVLVAANDTDRALLFTLTNTGNGSETFTLSIDNTDASDDFDPVASSSGIYFDTDSSGDFTVGDQEYIAGTNDPALAADESIDVFLVNDIPATVVNGNLGRSRILVASDTGTGAPGTVFAGAGDGGVDAVAGPTEGDSEATGEYLVSDVQINVSKSQVVDDQFGGNQPVPGATVTYTITVEVVGGGTATASAVSDPIPTFTAFTPGSMTLNAAPLTDAVGDDAGDYDTSGAPTVVVRLGDITAADGVQTVEFQVTID